MIEAGNAKNAKAVARQPPDVPPTLTAAAAGQPNGQGSLCYQALGEAHNGTERKPAVDREYQDLQEIGG